MKKMLFLIVSIVVLSLIPQIIFAETLPVATENVASSEIVYIETIIEDESLDMDSPNEVEVRGQKTVTKSKTTNYKNASGKVMWYIKVTGTFKYGNGSSVCTKATISADSKNKSWTVHNKSASKKGNKATAKATGKRHFNGAVVDTIRGNVTLSCSPTGNFY